MDSAGFAPAAAGAWTIIPQTTKKETLLPEEIYSLRVDRIVPETPRVITLLLRPETGDLPFRFSPGQHLGVRPRPSRFPEDEVPERWTHFSLSGSPENQKMAEITVRNQGKTSEAIHRLLPGDEVEVTRPEGSFILEEPVGHGPVFFGAGIGAAPLRSMVRACLDRNLGKAITCFLWYSTREDALFLDEFRTASDRFPRFRFWVHFSDASPARGQKCHRDPFYDPAWLRERIEKPDERTCYLCLPPGLRENVLSVLAAAGIPRERVRMEIW
jgi:ferredoxin-NADP reductase